MIRRCHDPRHKRYSEWGGRGIIVCPEWHDFQSFDVWATQNGYSKKLRLDRRDNNLGYFPSNCRFVSPLISCLNTKVRKDNKTGYTGILFNKKACTFTSRVHAFGVTHTLGTYPSMIEAVSIRNSFILQKNLSHKIQECYE